ncbi:unnamed protein product [Discosporangium mesarthrocarpum]
MKTSFIVGVTALVCFSCAKAFVVAPASTGHRPSRLNFAGSAPERTTTSRVAVGPLFAGEEGEGKEQEPMDLDLEQMFEVFEAADKEIPDEKKKGTTPKDKDPKDIVGDFMSNIFGGGDKK